MIVNLIITIVRTPEVFHNQNNGTTQWFKILNGLLVLIICGTALQFKINYKYESSLSISFTNGAIALLYMPWT